MNPIVRIFCLSFLLMFCTHNYVQGQEDTVLVEVKIPFENDSSKIEYHYFFIDGDSSMYHGKYIWYWVTGKVKARATYIAGEKTGPFWTFYQNGRKKTTGNFINGTTEGEVINYYKTGKKESSGPFVNGLKEGEWEYLSESGIKLKSEVYKDGMIVEE